MFNIDLRNKRVKCDLSGGINSMALLCWLAKYELKPKDLFIFYADFKEHSEDTLDFVYAGIRYAKQNFKNVIYKITDNSVLEYFEKEKMIPHPMYSPCSINLKINPAREFYDQNHCDFDLIGYVKNEIRRWDKKQKRNELFYNALAPILNLTDEDCFELVKQEIGWYPKIYDHRWTEEHYKQGLCKNRYIGKRIFKHNNCLFCKNMTIDEIKITSILYPEYAKKSLELAQRLNVYWGRENVPPELICEHCNLVN